MEAIAQHGGEAPWRRIVKSLSGSMLKLLESPHGAFVVRRVVGSCPTRALFESELGLDLVRLCQAALSLSRDAVVAAAVQCAAAYGEDPLQDALVRACVGGSLQWLLDLDQCRSGGGEEDSTPERRTRVSVNACVAVGAMWAFKPAVIRECVRAFVALPKDVLVLLCSGSVASRDLVEPCLQQAAHGVDLFRWAARRLLVSLAGRWADLACDRCGTWVTQRLHEVLDAGGQEVLRKELASARRRLEGSGPGHHVVRALRLYKVPFSGSGRPARG